MPKSGKATASVLVTLAPGYGIELVARGGTAMTAARRARASGVGPSLDDEPLPQFLMRTQVRQQGP
jgi:hypothetical protein